MQPKEQYKPGSISEAFVATKHMLRRTWMVLVLLYCLADAGVDEPKCLESSGVEVLICAGHGQPCHDKTIRHTA